MKWTYNGQTSLKMNPVTWKHFEWGDILNEKMQIEWGDIL